jgi:hypothetical protein
MTIENTKIVVELRDNTEVNEYLQLGWVLINQYVIDVGELGQPSQQPRYILAWQNSEAPVEHPENSSYLRHQREMEEWKPKSRI